ncbi:hypothetical protein AHF37_01516 [Paragonimus kellicotti]|nr:hypothetical protein AHF37_01516 [Paragonimus kellicotti]
MASSSTAHGYYCHSCEAEVDANLQDFTCSNCRSGFIEEVNRDVNSGAFFTAQGLGPEHLMRSFLEELSPFANVPSSSEPEDETMLDDYDEPHPRRSGRRSGGNRHSNNVERITVRFPSQPVLTPTVRLSSSGNPLLMHFISGLNPLQGDIRNYVLNQGVFENLLSLLATQMHAGPPPATEAAIQQLPVIELTEEQVAQYKTCSICFEDYQTSEKATRLPCQHIYHTTCVNTWLKQHATCPVCRKDLNGQDTSTMEDVPNSGSDAAANSSNS